MVPNFPFLIFSIPRYLRWYETENICFRIFLLGQGQWGDIGNRRGIRYGQMIYSIIAMPSIVTISVIIWISIFSDLLRISQNSLCRRLAKQKMLFSHICRISSEKNDLSIRIMLSEEQRNTSIRDSISLMRMP